MKSGKNQFKKNKHFKSRDNDGTNDGRKKTKMRRPPKMKYRLTWEEE